MYLGCQSIPNPVRFLYLAFYWFLQKSVCFERSLAPSFWKSVSKSVSRILEEFPGSYLEANSCLWAHLVLAVISEDIPRASHSPKGEEADLRHSVVDEAQLQHTPHNFTAWQCVAQPHASCITCHTSSPSSSPPPSSTIPSRHPTSSTPYLSRHDNGAECEGNGKGCTQVSTSASSDS